MRCGTSGHCSSSNGSPNSSRLGAGTGGTDVVGAVGASLDGCGSTVGSGLTSWSPGWVRWVPNGAASEHPIDAAARTTTTEARPISHRHLARRVNTDRDGARPAGAGLARACTKCRITNLRVRARPSSPGQRKASSSSRTRLTERDRMENDGTPYVQNFNGLLLALHFTERAGNSTCVGVCWAARRDGSRMSTQGSAGTPCSRPQTCSGNHQRSHDCCPQTYRTETGIPLA